MISLPSAFKTVSKGDNTAVFEISGLYPGYGLTIANSLRRVLLSSLPGTAVTKVRIEGVPHEFSTISNVKEDVIQILLNLKKLKFVLPDDQPQQISLEAKGEKKISGKDFNLSPQIKLANPDEHIATLVSPKAHLSMTVTIESGVGYQPVENRQLGKSVVGEILLDAVFSPIERVSYRVENMRVGERTDFNRIFLTIKTNGIIQPEEALIKASNILEDHFKLIGQSFELSQEKLAKSKSAKSKKESKEKKDKKEKQGVDIKKMKVEELKISTRVINALQNGGIKTIAGLISKTSDKLMELEGIREKGLEEIVKALKKLGLTLKE